MPIQSTVYHVTPLDSCVAAFRLPKVCAKRQSLMQVKLHACTTCDDVANKKDSCVVGDFSNPTGKVHDTRLIAPRPAVFLHLQGLPTPIHSTDQAWAVLPKVLVVESRF